MHAVCGVAMGKSLNWLAALMNQTQVPINLYVSLGKSSIRGIGWASLILTDRNAHKLLLLNYSVNTDYDVGITLRVCRHLKTTANYSGGSVQLIVNGGS